MDRGLVRFGKFAAVLLGIFLIVGVYAFGFRIEVAVEHARRLQSEVAVLEPEVRSAKAELQKARSELDTARTTALQRMEALAKLQVEAETKVKVIDTFLIYSQRQLTPEQQQRAAQTATELGVERPSVGLKLWPNHSTLTVRFLGGSSALVARVQRYMNEWASHTNLTIKYVASGATSIRVAFLPNMGTWSTLGTDALGIADSEATMNLGVLNDDSPEEHVRRFTLHEFGHALGLIEEMNNPSGNIPWNRPVVISDLKASGWSEKSIERTLFFKYDRNIIPMYRPFDSSSIMMIEVPPHWTSGKFSAAFNDKLSSSDIELIRRLYPKT